MTYVAILTGVFRGLYILGALVATSAAVRYHTRTAGAWREHRTGRMLMRLVCALAVAFWSVTLRVLTMFARRSAPWADDLVLIVASVAVVMVVVSLAQFWFMVEREQPNYSKDITETNSQEGAS